MGKQSQLYYIVHVIKVLYSRLKQILKLYYVTETRQQFMAEINRVRVIYGRNPWPGGNFLCCENTPAAGFWWVKQCESSLRVWSERWMFFHSAAPIDGWLVSVFPYSPRGFFPLYGHFQKIIYPQRATFALCTQFIFHLNSAAPVLNLSGPCSRSQMAGMMMMMMYPPELSSWLPLAVASLLNLINL